MTSSVWMHVPAVMEISLLVFDHVEVPLSSRLYQRRRRTTTMRRRQ